MTFTDSTAEPSAPSARMSALSVCVAQTEGGAGREKEREKGGRSIAPPINYEFGVKKNRRPCQSGRRFFDDLPSEAALSMLGAVGLGRLDILRVYRPRL